MGRVTLQCPNCQQQFEVIRPDSGHTCWSLDKPQDDEATREVVEQVYECTNLNCKTKFTIYWYETTMYLNRA